MASLLDSEKFRVEATGLNGFGKAIKRQKIVEGEKKMEPYARRILYQKKRFFPGFFVIWAKRPER